MGFRLNRLARESFEHTEVDSEGNPIDINLENNGELTIAPSALSVAISDSIHARTEVIADASEISEMSDVIELANSDVETLESIESSLEDEDREVSEEEAETIKLVTEGYANRYGFVMSRELATESFGSDRKSNREIALKHIREAKLGTESFVADAVSGFFKKVGDFFKSIFTLAGRLEDMGKRLAEHSGDGSVKTIDGDDRLHAIYSNLAFDRVYKGNDLNWLKTFAKANLGAGAEDFAIDGDFATDLVEYLKGEPTDKILNIEDARKAVPSINKFFEKQKSLLTEIGLDGRGLPVLGHERLTDEDLIKVALTRSIPLVGGLVSYHYEDKLIKQNSSKISTIEPAKFREYGDFMIELANDIRDSKLLKWGGSAAKVNAKAKVKEAKAFVKGSDLPAESKKIANDILDIDKNAMIVNIRIRVENLTALCVGLTDLAYASV